MFETKGIDLLAVIKEAKENGNVEFAELIEKQIANVQACYNVCAQKWTATGKDMWNVSADYLRGELK